MNGSRKEVGQVAHVNGGRWARGGKVGREHAREGCCYLHIYFMKSLTVRFLDTGRMGSALDWPS